MPVVVGAAVRFVLLDIVSANRSFVMIVKLVVAPPLFCQRCRDFDPRLNFSEEWIKVEDWLIKGVWMFRVNSAKSVVAAQSIGRIPAGLLSF